MNLSANIREFLKTSMGGDKEMYPAQEKSINEGLLDGQSMVVAAPTGSGKTAIAVMGILACLERKAGKIIYLSPMRALATEKYNEFKEFERLDINGTRPKVSISTGDPDNKETKFENADVIVMTNERMDSFIRHRPDWITDVGLVIADEIHMVGDDKRGPSLEMALTHIKRMAKAQILGLSATIPNVDDLARWLGAKTVISDYRPVELREGVCDDGMVYMNGEPPRELQTPGEKIAVRLGLEEVKNDGQVILFAKTKVQAASFAKESAGPVSTMINNECKRSLDEASKRILKGNLTDSAKRTAELVKQGVAFHHAGLGKKSQDIIVDEFRKKNIRLIASTPTLAVGVNLPARRVVIASLSRYINGKGNRPIGVGEYKQMAGRAGRPQYDTYGEAIIVVRKEGINEAKRYTIDEPEAIGSHLIELDYMYSNIVGMLVIHDSMTEGEIMDFFKDTLAGTQEHSQNKISQGIIQALGFLVLNKLIIEQKTDNGTRYKASGLGRLVAMKYLNPKTAIEFLRVIKSVRTNKDHTLGMIHAITTCHGFTHTDNLVKRGREIADALLDGRKHEMFGCNSGKMNKATLALYKWIKEETPKHIEETVDVWEGTLHAMKEGARWLLYCFAELARHEHNDALREEATRLKIRVEYGIKDELLDLVKLKNVGRARARNLHNSGYTDRKSLRNVPVRKIARVEDIGDKIAKGIVEQVNPKDNQSNILNKAKSE